MAASPTVRRLRTQLSRCNASRLDLESERIRLLERFDDLSKENHQNAAIARSHADECDRLRTLLAGWLHRYDTTEAAKLATATRAALTRANQVEQR